MKEYNPVTPKHYEIIPPGEYPKGLEYFDIMTYALAHHDDPVVAHAIGNAFKYLFRAGRKHPEKLSEDLKKAIWYLDYAAKLAQPEPKF